MTDSRVRQRVQAEATGTGQREPSGAAFGFRVLDFTVAGVRLAVSEGEPPALGERVALAFAPQRLDGFDTPVRVSGAVRRVDGPGAASGEGDAAGEVTCGVALDAVRSPDDGTALDEAYLEHFLMQQD